MRSAERGFVTLAALLDIMIITLVGSLLMTSLFGEIQGEFGYNEAVSALSIAEAGVHWAGNKLGPAGTSGYTGDTGQAVQGANGTQVGVFDVAVTCANGSLVSTGCAGQPARRHITSTGYVPSKTSTLGKRTVQTEVALNNPIMAICAYQAVIMNANGTAAGNVGSEGSIQLDSGAQIAAGGGQPGNAYAVSTITCAAPCGSQIAGTVNPGQTPGTVCPSQARVAGLYTCTAQTTDPSLSGSNLTISSSGSYSTITLASGGTLTFVVPTGQTLTVQVVTFHASSNSIVQIQGGGTVRLIASSQQLEDGNSTLGRDAGSGSLVAPSQLLIENCNTSSSIEAIHFNAGTTVSAVLIAPYGIVHLDAGINSRGAVLGNTVKLDAGNTFAYDPSVNISTYPQLVAWQDVP